MKTTRMIVAIAFATLPALSLAQTAGKAARKVETEAALQAEAKITESAAQAIALKRVGAGTVKSSEIEREKGHLVYSFDITVPGKTGIDEVLVDAISGKVISYEHETPKMEKAEARMDAQEKAKAGRKK